MNLDLLVEVSEVPLASVTLDSFFLLLWTVSSCSAHALDYASLIHQRTAGTLTALRHVYALLH